jgi:hypothetical protein
MHFVLQSNIKITCVDLQELSAHFRAWTQQRKIARSLFVAGKRL